MTSVLAKYTWTGSECKAGEEPRELAQFQGLVFKQKLRFDEISPLVDKKLSACRHLWLLATSTYGVSYRISTANRVVSMGRRNTDSKFTRRSLKA
jgi:hypothetical protein